MKVFGHIQLENEKYVEKHYWTKFAKNDALNNMHFLFPRFKAPGGSYGVGP